MRITNTDGRQATFTVKGLGDFTLGPGQFIDLDDKYIDIVAPELRLFDVLSLSAALGSGSSILHSTLLGLSADDHPHYLLADGSRAFAGNVDLGGFRATNAAPPIAGSDLVTRDFVTSVLNSVFWQDAVLDRDLTTAPASPSNHDRYIIAGTGGAWSAGSINDIATWSDALGQWEFATPGEGWAVYIEDENIYAHWNGSSWIKIGNVIDHAVLLNLNVGDPHPQYLLVDGTRALAGDLNMGTNNITNVGNINGISITAHGSRHNPDGADPISVAVPITISDSTNAIGSANSVSRSDHQHAHGDRGGGSLHALVVAAGPAGFMSGTDKSKLDNYPTLPANITGIDHGSLIGLGDDDHTQYLLINGSRAMTGALDMGTNNITNAGTINGISITAHGTRHNPDGADPITTAAAVTITDSTNSAGSANSVARSDHGHAHGTRGGGTLHANATTSVAGFMSSTDKTKLDGYPTAPYGSQRHYQEFTGSTTSSYPTPAQITRLTTSSLPAGTYRISYCLIISRSGGAGRGVARIQVDDTINILPEWQETVSNTAAFLVVSGYREVALGAGVHNIDVDGATTSGASTIFNTGSSISLIRVA